ncbi:hypothetical protein AZF06_21590 [Priestia endophytica]|nr:hypothetical protein AZF06_21590 [Priestia endophytica]
MTYRPTIRCHQVFEEYVDELFHATYLDRNQIIRCSLFTSAHSPLFLSKLEFYKSSSSLPSPMWEPKQDLLWLERSPFISREGRDVTHVEHTGKRSYRNPFPIAKPAEKTEPTDEKRKRREGEDSPKKKPGPQREVSSRTIKTTERGGIIFKLG